MTLQEKAELCDMFYRTYKTYGGFAAAHHLRINESSIKDHNEKKEQEIHEAITAVRCRRPTPPFPRPPPPQPSIV